MQHSVLIRRRITRHAQYHPVAADSRGILAEANLSFQVNLLDITDLLIDEAK